MDIWLPNSKIRNVDQPIAVRIAILIAKLASYVEIGLHDAKVCNVDNIALIKVPRKNCQEELKIAAGGTVTRGEDAGAGVGDREWVGPLAIE